MMNKPIFCAVVLNYKVYSETIECVNSLLLQNYSPFFVVIVENGSANGSYEILSDSFSQIDNVKIVKSEQNLGFAKGNNLGINYARSKLGADFVFVVNSDVVVSSDLFSQVSEIDYKGIGVISPVVNKPDGSYQLPNENFDNINKRIRYLISHLLMGKVLYTLKKSRKGVNDNKPRAKSAVASKWNRYVLQGCSFFLTPEFFSHYTQLYPKTFLYWEEIDLLFYLYKAGLKSVIAETDPVIHKDKGTTSQVAGNISKFQLDESIKSMLKSIPLFFCNCKKIKMRFN